MDQERITDPAAKPLLNRDSQEGGVRRCRSNAFSPACSVQMCIARPMCQLDGVCRRMNMRAQMCVDVCTCVQIMAFHRDRHVPPARRVSAPRLSRASRSSPYRAVRSALNRFVHMYGHVCTHAYFDAYSFFLRVCARGACVRACPYARARTWICKCL